MSLFKFITETVSDIGESLINKTGSAIELGERTAKLPPVQLAIKNYVGGQFIPNGGSLGSGEFANTDVILTGGQKVATNGGFLDTLISGVKSGVDAITGLANPINTLGFITGRDQALINTGPATTTTGNLGAQETTDSGTITINTNPAGTTTDANALVGLLNPLLKGIKNNPLTSIGLGGSAIGAVSSLVGNGSKQRFRTKDVRIARSVYNLMNRDLVAAANILQIDVGQLSAMLLQKLPAPNPAPTAAALKKTRSTIRKLDRMCNLRDEIAKHAKTTTRRRSPMRRASTTTLSKN